MSKGAKKLEIVNQSLPTLVAQANALAEKLIEAQGLLDPETESALAVNEKELAVKVDSYAVIIDRFSWEVDYLKAQAKQFTDAAKAVQNAQDRLKENLRFAMANLKVDEIAGESFKFKLQNNPPKLNIDPTKLPEEYKIQVISMEPDKDKINDAIAAGLSVMGASIEVGNHVRKYVNKGAK